MKDKEKCCLTCKHYPVCPIIVKWVEETEAPILSASFYCSEYEVVTNED